MRAFWAAVSAVKGGSGGRAFIAVSPKLCVVKVVDVGLSFPQASALYIKAATAQANGRLLSTRPIIRLKPKEGRRVKSGAPWVFSNEIVMEGAAKSLPPGTLVELAADDGAKL